MSIPADLGSFFVALVELIGLVKESTGEDDLTTAVRRHSERLRAEARVRKAAEATQAERNASR